MENYKNFMPDHLFYVITEGKTCELCVRDKNVVNFTKFSDFLLDNIIINVDYCYVMHCKLQDGGTFVLSGGFKLRNLVEDDIEMIYKGLINYFIDNYSGNEIINNVNVSFHPRDITMRFLEFKSKVGL